MRHVVLTCVLLMALQSAHAEDRRPSRAYVVDMAHYFVQDWFLNSGEAPGRVAFDVASLRPQPDPDLWTVTGGFVAAVNSPGFFVASIRLICADYEKIECWSLEKLAINRDTVVDKGRPL